MTLKEIVAQKSLLKPEQLEEVLKLQAAEGLRFDRAVVQLGYLSERQMLGVLSEQLQLPLVSLERATIDTEALRALPPSRDGNGDGRTGSRTRDPPPSRTRRRPRSRCRG